jgi:AraC family transcriptional regulator of adaptative response/methylated-DNA-[protein]-cysteine methyltransferase
MRRAFASKDPAYNGLFVAAIKTTGVYCRPTCRSRTPRPENIEFFPSPQLAERAGYRPCKRCKPDAADTTSPVVSALLAQLQADLPLSESDLRARGIDPSTARRHFKSHTGHTFSQYQRHLRLSHAHAELQSGQSALNAQLAAGFESSSAFRAAIEKLFGSPPSHTLLNHRLASAWLPTPLGHMLAIAHDTGLALLDFADRKGLPAALTRLRSRFGTNAHPAVIIPVPPHTHPILSQTARELDAYFAGTSFTFTVPLLPPGTPFEKLCWDYLRTIPPGEVRSYAQQAAAIGSPNAVRAVGRANGMNYLALLIPCHRVIAASGHLTGYGGGLHRKHYLLHHERNAGKQAMRQ